MLHTFRTYMLQMFIAVVTYVLITCYRFLQRVLHTFRLHVTDAYNTCYIRLDYMLQMLTTSVTYVFAFKNKIVSLHPRGVCFVFKHWHENVQNQSWRLRTCWFATKNLCSVGLSVVWGLSVKSWQHLGVWCGY